MIKKWILTIFTIIIFYILQTTLFQHIMLAHVVPNLLIIITVSTGYISGRRDALITGLLCGLISDCIFGSLIGVHALIYMLVGYLSGYTHYTYSDNDILLPVLYIGVSDIIYGFMYYVFEFLLRGRLSFLFYLRTIILPEALYTILVGILFYRLYSVAYRFFVRKNSREAI
ncbi:MAG: rod shape-determining protein MreD [Lachnospiraceae bacterium]|nr:rod shape-determining protein MreD [Lachnospiraceae bacterium]